LEKTQVQFAAILGCQANTVARWERGAVRPATIQLMRLRDLAKGDDKEPFIEELRRLSKPIIIHADPASYREYTAMAGWKLFGPEQAGWKPIDSVEPKTEGSDHPPAPEVLFDRIDDTLYEMMSDLFVLWKRYKSDPQAVQYFRDAMGFLRVQLAGRETPAAQEPEQPDDPPTTPKP
jgi:hypothetical protein